jgi:hypothetical protein
MGGDGGVKATQRRFIRGYKNPKDRDETRNIRDLQRIRSKLCCLTSKPLTQPVTGCELGNLYNKEDILKALIDKTLNENFSHVRGLKDLKTLKFTENPAYDNSKENEIQVASKFICPITGDEFNGSTPFSFVWTTGFVLSDRGIRELGIESLQTEYGPFTITDLIKINPLPEDLPALRAQMEVRRTERTHKKRKRDKNANDESQQEHSLSDNLISHSSRLKKGQKRDLSSTSEHPISLLPSKISTSTNLVRAASEQVQMQRERSHVYQGLFHKDHEADKKDRDLFMSVAGIRYTLS